MVAGSAAQIADQVQAKILDVGVGGRDHQPAQRPHARCITAVAEALAPAARVCNAGRFAPALVADYTRSQLGVADCV